VQLIRLRTDLVERVDWTALCVQPVPAEALRAFYLEMELHSLARELDAVVASPPPAPKPAPAPKPDAQMNLF
jgi:hypothetical protein